MTLDEAIELAREIHAADGLHLMAIGRFVPADQLTGCEDWACSVAVIGGQPHNICRSVANWRALVATHLKGRSAARQQAKSEPLSTDATAESKKKQGEEPGRIQHLSTDEQPLLF
ncbi:MAG: hypothetical protein Aurels2KO_25600 [Aureliella sp.]